MYLVTTENIDDGIWFDDPEGYDTKQEATDYIMERKDKLIKGNCFVLYFCDLIDTFQDDTLAVTPHDGKAMP